METFVKKNYPEFIPTKVGQYDTNLGMLYWNKGQNRGWTRNIGDALCLKGITYFYQISAEGESISYKIFDEDALRREIVRVWGEHGAHMEVFNRLMHSSQLYKSVKKDAKEFLKSKGVIAILEETESFKEHIRWKTAINAKELIDLLTEFGSSKIQADKMSEIEAEIPQKAYKEALTAIYGYSSKSDSFKVDKIIIALRDKGYLLGVGSSSKGEEKWISVEKELAPEGEMVIVLFDYGDKIMFEVDECSKSFKPLMVTHWQPLPAFIKSKFSAPKQ
jgi:hypothetical protein